MNITVVFGNEQWIVRLDEPDGQYSIRRTGPNQRYDIVNGKNGQPQVRLEPALSFWAPAGLIYVDGQYQPMAYTAVGTIGAVICQNGMEYTLSAAKEQGVVIRPNGDESIQVGPEIWWLATIVDLFPGICSGKTALLVRSRPAEVQVLSFVEFTRRRF